MSSFFNFEVGSRIKDGDGHRATVRYVGPVAAAKKKDEVWLGVEWDSQTRGKHDGSCVDEDGIYQRYFECPPTAGSFIKPGKVIGGRSLVEALKDRYVEFDAPQITEPGTNIVPDAFVNVGSKGKQKSIEFVGEQKVRKWQQISTVSKIAVRNDTINSMGDSLGDIASHLVAVDLQDNLLYQWSEIASLSRQLPLLSELLLHGNKMEEITTAVCLQLTEQGTNFGNLTILALNSCNIRSWRSIQLLEPLLPVLEELYLAGNSLQDLHNRQEELEFQAATGTTPPVEAETAVTGFKHLKMLNLSACLLTDWSQAEAFRHLPCLRELVLDCNDISAITTYTFDALPSALLSVTTTAATTAATTITTTDSGTTPTTIAAAATTTAAAYFPSLQRLSISSSKLSKWSDVDNLDRLFPALRMLRLSHVPLFTGRGASEVRPLVIARIGNLEVFNGSGVSPRERIDSEKNYLRAVLRDVEKVKKEDSTDTAAAAAAAATTTAAATAAATEAALPAVVSDTSVSSAITNVLPVVSEASSPTEPPLSSGLSALLAMHPRFAVLNKQYGADLIPMATENAAGGAIAAELLTITLKNLSFGSGGSLEPKVKKLPRTLTVSKLRLMVKQLFGLDPRLQDLSLRVYKDSPPVLLEDEMGTLGYYGALDGAEVFVNEKKKE